MDAKNIYFKIGMEEPSKFTLYFFLLITSIYFRRFVMKTYMILSIEYNTHR